MTENTKVDLKAAMLGMSSEERLELLKMASLAEQLEVLKAENERLKVRRGGRPAAPKLSNDETRKAKEAVIRAFVRVEAAGLDELGPKQVHTVIEQTIPTASKGQIKAVLDEMVEHKVLAKNGKKGAGSAFSRNK